MEELHESIVVDKVYLSERRLGETIIITVDSYN
jgi:hypothetical protein